MGKRPIFFIVLAAMLASSCATRNAAQDTQFGSEDEFGLIAIGTKSNLRSDQKLDLMVVEFDPASKAPVGGLFSTGSLINIRVKPNTTEVEYAIVEARPGIYAISGVKFMPSGQSDEFEYTRMCNSAYFEVKPGMVTYIGDYAIKPGIRSQVSRIGVSEDDVDWYIRTLPNVTAQFVVAEPVPTEIIQRNYFGRRESCE